MGRMTTRAQIRKVAAALPDAVESADGRALSFEVAKKTFAEVGAEGGLVLHLSRDDVADLLSQESASVRGKAGTAVIPVADLSGQACHYWLMRAWSHRAPAPLRTRMERANAAEAGKVGDLPKAIGTPATRALVTNGVESLADLCTVTREEVAGWHGVGGKAVGILEAALDEAGLTFG